MQLAARRIAGALGLLLPLLLLCGVVCGEAARASRRRSFGFRVQSRDFQPTFRRSLLRNATMPLHGAVKDFGYFYATLYLGTPAKKFAVIVDTGSTMTYVPCSTCGSGCGPNHQDAAFDPQASSSASLISCTSPKCSCGSPRCGCSAQQCTYTRSYAEQSSSSGVLLEDVLAMHDGQAGAPIIFGCETRETGEIFKQRADGLFGLGNSDASVVNQLVKAGVIDDVFSLCFGMVEGDGALLLGDMQLPGGIQLQYTPLLRSATHPFYYNVRMLSLAVDGQLLPVPQALFDQGYGTVLDSGTTFTYMPTPVFQAFSSAVEKFVLAHGLKRVPGPDPQYQDICFGTAPHHQDLEGLSGVFPSMEIQFDQGTSLILGPLNYLFVHTFNSGKYCLGVFDNGRAGTLLGGITFRNVLVQYDRAKQRVGFGPAPCKELGEMQRPPCSYFAVEGGNNELMATAAASDGDCTMETMRQQAQEWAEDVDDTVTTGTQPAEQEPQPQPAAAASATEASGVQWRRPPEEQQQKVVQEAAQQEGQAEVAPKAGTQAQVQQPQQASQQAAAAQQQQEQQQQAQQQSEQPTAVAAQGGQSTPPDQPAAQQVQQQEQQQEAPAVGGIVRPGGGSAASAPGGKGSVASVALGMLVAAAVVLSLGFAVALLQPATRDRIRGLFGSGSRQYRSLEEQDRDPEGGAFAPATSAPGAGATSSTHGGGGGGALEMAATGSSAPLKSIDLGGGAYHASPRAAPRGITTPQKLQRSVSNVETEAAAAMGGSMPTPRAGGVPTPRAGGGLTPRANGSANGLSPLR